MSESASRRVSNLTLPPVPQGGSDGASGHTPFSGSGGWELEVGARGEAMAEHDLADGARVGRSFLGDGLGDDGPDLAEVGAAEDAGRDDGEGAGGRGGKIVETVDDAPRDEDVVAGFGVDALRIAGRVPEGEGEVAFERVGGLVVGVVAVRDGNTRARHHRELKHGERAVGGGFGGAVHEEADVDGTERNLSRWHRRAFQVGEV